MGKLNWLARKALTKPIWYWETRRRYRVRERIWECQPVCCPADADVRLLISSTAGTLQDAAWTAASFLRHLPEETGLAIAADGFPPFARDRLLRIFPGVLLLEDQSAIAEMERIAPNVAKLANYHPMGRKLSSILHLQRKAGLVFSDADVLCFRSFPRSPPPQEATIAGDSLSRTISVTRRILLAQMARPWGFPFTPGSVAASCMFRRQSLDTGLASRLLETGKRIDSWFPDTMVLAFLMELAGGRPLPADTYVQNVDPQLDKT